MISNSWISYCSRMVTGRSRLLSNCRGNRSLPVESTPADTLLEMRPLYLRHLRPKVVANMNSSTLESSISRTARLITGFWQAVLANLGKQWIAQIRWEREIRRNIDALMALDERMLHDIGLTRGAVEYAARYGRLPTPLSNQGCRQISLAAENPEEYQTGRMPSVRAEGHTAVRALLIAHGIFAACAIALSQAQSAEGQELCQ